MIVFSLSLSRLKTLIANPSDVRFHCHVHDCTLFDTVGLLCAYDLVAGMVPFNPFVRWRKNGVKRTNASDVL